MVATLALFVFGFIILVKGANFLVKGGSALARYLGISGFVIGVLIAGIGTSIPEFGVTFMSNLVGEGDVGLGTIIGSNTFNLLFILGLCSLFYPLFLKREWVARDLVWNIAAILLVGLVAANGFISRPEGIFLTICCIAWIWVVARGSHEAHDKEATHIAVSLSFLLAIAGLVGVLAGSYFVVEGAIAIAIDLGVSEVLVGLLIVGIGTSLPEIAVSFAAAAKRQYGIAIGNIIGSNVFDFLGIIGISAVARAIPFKSTLMVDLSVTAAAAFLVYFLVSRSRDYKLGRLHGALLLLLFGIYTLFVVIRG